MQPKSLARLLRVLSTERRVEIIGVLLSNPDPIPSSVIAAAIGLSEGQTSFNLTQLANVGIVMRIPSGRFAFYTPNRALVAEIFAFFNRTETNDARPHPAA